jgi:cytochrome c oxidase cbb3-type subunit 3
MSSSEQEIPELPAQGLPPRDGIGEDDAAVPGWFTWSFFGTWAIALVYIVYYVGIGGWSSRAQYRQEVAEAEARYAAVRASQAKTNPFRGDDAAIQEGATVFAQICAACHLADGKGLVGPSLVDPYWKYGSDDESKFLSVAEGRPGGMPAWGPQLGTEKIWKALAFVESLPPSSEPGFGAPDYQPATP